MLVRASNSTPAATVEHNDDGGSGTSNPSSSSTAYQHYQHQQQQHHQNHQQHYQQQQQQHPRTSAHPSRWAKDPRATTSPSPAPSPSLLALSSPPKATALLSTLHLPDTVVIDGVDAANAGANVNTHLSTSLENGPVSSDANSGNGSTSGSCGRVLGIRLTPLQLSGSKEHEDEHLHRQREDGSGGGGGGVTMTGRGGEEYGSLEEAEAEAEVEARGYVDVESAMGTAGLAPSPRRRMDYARSSENLESLVLSPSARSVTTSPRHYTPSMRSGTNTPRSSGGGAMVTGGGGVGIQGFMVDQMVLEAWDGLRRSRVMFRGRPVGTIAAMDSSEAALNYDQVFVRDFIPSALAFLMNGEHEIVQNFLLKTLRLQSWEKRVDVFTLGEGVMPASFKVLHDARRNMDTMVADFGESAIGRVAPVDSGFWWIILLRAYVKATGDTALAESPDCQRGMRLILNLCLSDGFDTFPTLLCADGCCMIDRRMGIYGYPIEIQSLFYMALRTARGLLRSDLAGNKELLERIDKRLVALSYHMRTYFWLDHEQLNNIYRYKTEEYSHTAVNKFNVIPDSIPDWLFDFMPMKGGYFVGNVSPARMDFRWFAVGNCMAILSSLATRDQGIAIMDLIEERWDELVGEMPLKVAYPALENHEWRITTGCDPKNTRWSYHNGGSWPVLLWMLTAASIKVGRPHMARRAIEVAELRLARDGWPEYYDGKLGRYIGKQARKHQTWSIAGYLVAKMLLEDPSHLGMVALEEERKLQYPPVARTQSWKY